MGHPTLIDETDCYKKSQHTYPYNYIKRDVRTYWKNYCMTPQKVA